MKFSLVILSFLALVLFVFPISQSHASADAYYDSVIATTGLQGYWRLNESAGTTINDSFGSKNGTFTGLLTYQVTGALVSSTDKSITFANGTGRGSVPNASSNWISGGIDENNQEMSIEGWVYPPNNPTDHKFYFGFRNFSDADFYITQLANSNNLEARFRDNYGSTFDLTGVVTPNQWNYLVLQRRGSILVLYLNGVLVDTEQGVYGTFPSNTETLQIANSNSSTAPLGLDDIAVYNKYLDVDSIKQHYNLGRNTSSRSVDLNPDNSHWWGSYVDGFPDYPANIGALDTFSNLVGNTPYVTNLFQAWGDGSSFEFLYGDIIRSRDSMMMVTWMPSGSPLSDYSLQKILDGNFDSYITTFAQKAASWNHPFLLRFAHEMNGNGYYPWQVGTNSNTAAKFILAWQHVHDIFVAQGTTNAQWVWCPNENTDASGFPTSLSSLYPGDSYVDWTCMDGYNDGTNGGSTWQTFTQLFSSTYTEIQAIAPSKNMLIGEVGAVEQGGDKAGWITNAFSTEIPNLFPKVKGIIWFNQNGTYDWRINSTSPSLSAFVDAIALTQWDDTPHPTPTPTASPTPTATPTVTPTITPTLTPSPTTTVTPEPIVAATLNDEVLVMGGGGDGPVSYVSISNEVRNTTTKPINQGYTITVKVFNQNNELLHGAKVILNGIEKLTDDKGFITFENIKTGNYEILVIYEDTETKQNINVTANNLDFTIKANSTTSSNTIFPIVLGIIVLIVFAGIFIQIRKSRMEDNSF